ncbi:hypothetical protein GCM10022377_00960 [Zhihengliuella alba]|uniref:AB hydrolase-1 domain-containing protein n=1 Tax=Zhihengliuella alba TaxID=547018 RepID=A0ABP7CMR3_9MICC
MATFPKARSPRGRSPRSPWERRDRFAVDGLQVDVLSTGRLRGSDAPVVLVHGIGVSPRYFEPLAAVLAARTAVHAIELPGFGTTPRPRRTLSIPEFADAVAGALRRAGLDEVVLVGQSMGCQIAAEAAARHPGLAGTLVLLGPTVNDRERSAPRQGLRLAQDMLRESAAANAVVLSDYFRAGPVWYFRTLGAMLEHRLEDALPRVRCPVRLARGALDPIAPPDWLERLRRVSPGAAVSEVPGQAHLAMFGDPRAVCRLCLPAGRGADDAAAAPSAPEVQRPRRREPRRREPRRREPRPAGASRRRTGWRGTGWRGTGWRRALGWLRERVRLGVAWALDYAYVGYWQVHGFLFPREAAAYARRPEGSARQPVVLLPGIYENWQFMHPVAEHLHRAGHPVHVVSRLGYNRGTVPAMAALVAAFLEERGLHDVILVAHSKGGLIGKYLMTMPGASDRVSRLVAVNSPFSGSVYADFFLIPSIRAFSPRNATLRQLRENLHVNERITSIYASFDPHIPGGSRLAGATNVELEAMGHFRVIGDARLLAALDDAISDDTPHDDVSRPAQTPPEGG